MYIKGRLELYIGLINVDDQLISLRAPLAIEILHVIYYYVSLLLSETLGARQARQLV